METISCLVFWNDDLFGGIHKVSVKKENEDIDVGEGIFENPSNCPTVRLFTDVQVVDGLFLLCGPMIPVYFYGKRSTNSLKNY